MSVHHHGQTETDVDIFLKVPQNNKKKKVVALIELLASQLHHISHNAFAPESSKAVKLHFFWGFHNKSEMPRIVYSVKMFIIRSNL